MSEWDPWERYRREQERRMWDPFYRYEYGRDRMSWDPWFRELKRREWKYEDSSYKERVFSPEELSSISSTTGIERRLE